MALYTIGRDGLGIASAATTVSLGNRNLDSGIGGLTGFYGVFGVGGTGAALAVGRAASTYAKVIIGGNLSTTTTNAYGLVIEPTMTWDGAATPVSTALQITPAYSGTFTLVYGAYLQSGSGGTIGTAYSLYCAAPSSGTTKYTAYFDGGVGIGAANATTNNFALRSTTVHLGDGFDGTAYGQLQITRPAANGTSFHQSFVRSGNAVFGLGYLSSSNTFGIQSGGDNTGSAGIFVDSAGSVGIGQRVPLQKLHVEGTVDGGVLGMCRNLSTGTGAYSGFFVQNSGGSVCAWFMNSTTRVADGPANSATLRNDAGALRLLSSGSVGITLAASTGLAAFGAGLTLPTSGGTASTFDYYEELIAATSRLNKQTNNKISSLSRDRWFLHNRKTAKPPTTMNAPPTTIQYGTVAATVTAAGDLGECSICRTELNVDSTSLELSCGHVFHSDCIQVWFTQSVQQPPSCPLCRDVQSTAPANPALFRRLRAIPHYGMDFEFAYVLHVLIGFLSLSIVIMSIDKMGPSTMYLTMALDVSRVIGYFPQLCIQVYGLRRFSRELRRDTVFTFHAFWSLALTPLHVLVVIQLARFANSHPVYIVMLVFESLCLVLSVCLYCVVLGRSFCTELPRPLVPAFIEGLV